MSATNSSIKSDDNDGVKGTDGVPASSLEWREWLIRQALENDGESGTKRTCAEISGDDEATTQAMNCILVPCLAKSMPADHTLENAYFLIPVDIRHGTDLVCSHPKCRDAGSKFRYCWYCSGPVLRRNFSTRHNHSDQADSIREKRESDTRAMYGIPDQVTTKKARHSGGNNGDIASSGASSKGEPSECSFAVSASASSKSHLGRPASRSWPTLDSSSSSASMTAKRLQPSSQEDAKHLSKEDEKSCPSDESVAVALSTSQVTCVSNVAPVKSASGRQQDQQMSSQDDDTDSLVSGDSMDLKRHFMWATLLAKRPKSNDKSDMSKWLMDVLSVSDGHGRLRSANESSPTTDSSGNEKGEMPTDQSGTAGSSRTDGSSNESVDTPEINKASDTTPTDRSSNDNDNGNESSNDSSSEDMRTEND